MTEDQEQTRLATWLDKQNIPFHAIPNGGSRHLLEAIKLKRCGVKKGVPDLFITVPIHPYHGLYIEMKRTKNSVVSEDQLYWIDKLNKIGYLAEIAYGFEQAKLIVNSYLKNNVIS